MILRLAIAVTLGLARMAQAEVAVTMAYLHVEQPLPPTLSNLDPVSYTHLTLPTIYSV